MFATVCNVFEVMLRTPGESINATMKINAIVFTLSGDLNVRLFVINQSVKIDQDQVLHNALLQQQFLHYQKQTVPSFHHRRY